MDFFLPIIGIIIAIFFVSFLFKKLFKITNAQQRHHDESFKRDNDEFTRY